MRKPIIFEDMFALMFTFLLFSQALSFDPSTDLLNEKFQGTWTSLGKPFSFLNQTQGNIQLIYGNSDATMRQSSINIAQFTILDPQYHSCRKVHFQIPLGQYSSFTQSWNNTKEITFQLIREGLKEKQIICNTFYDISMMYNNQRSQQQYRFIINVTVLPSQVQQCKLQLLAQTKPHSNQAKIFYYSIFVALVSGISIVFLVLFYKKYSQDVRALSRISIICISLSLVQLWYMIFIHICLLITEKSNYGFFLIPIALVTIQSTLILMILKAVFQANYQANLTKKKWLLLVFGIIFVLIAYGFLMFLFPYGLYTILAQSFIIIFQIIKNSRQTRPVKVGWNYVAGCFQLQYIIGLYYRGCPNNIYSVEPSLSFLFYWNGIYFMQIIILFIQRKIGGGFFLPDCLLGSPNGYSLMKQSVHQDQCGICICSFRINQQFAKTKCGHLYHQQCLTQWLKINQKCPMCRVQIQQR